MRIAVAGVVTVAAFAGVVACAGGAPERAQAPASAALSLRVVARGLDSPVHVAAPASEPRRLYVVERPGRIRVLQNGRLLAAPFLDIRPQVQSGGEQGLLSVAFHPQYARNRRFYVNFTDLNGHTNVVEYRSNGARALPRTARRLLFARQPYGNHNGGQIAFGRDGRLYVGTGDGGSGGDPENRAQNPASPLGKLLSLEPGSGRARLEALGLRNPWRFSFDRATGDLWIGDVGQGAWEEIDFLPRRSPGVENFGWSRFEGRKRYSGRELTRGRYVPPVHAYGRADGSCSVTGGFVYRGAAVAAAKGRYFFGDFCSGNVWSLRLVAGKARGLRREPFRVSSLSSFGEDARGELYAVSLGGAVYRLAG